MNITCLCELDLEAWRNKLSIMTSCFWVYCVKILAELHVPSFSLSPLLSLSLRFSWKFFNKNIVAFEIWQNKLCRNKRPNDLLKLKKCIESKIEYFSAWRSFRQEIMYVLNKNLFRSIILPLLVLLKDFLHFRLNSIFYLNFLVSIMIHFHNC